MSKKRLKHHIIGNAQKKKKRIKQSFWRRIIEPRIIEVRQQKEEALKKTREQLKKGLKKIEITPRKKRMPQRKGKIR